MYLLEEDVYNETRIIKAGKLEKSPLLKELSDWLAKEFNVKVLNFRFDTVKFAKRKKFRLRIILDDEGDYKKMVPDVFKKNETVENLIALKFKSLALQHEFPIDNRTKNIFVIFYDYSKEARSEANNKALKGFAEQIKSEYPTVWDVYGAFDTLIVFFYLDGEIEENRKNGIIEVIRNKYYKAVKQFDDMSYFTRENLKIKFDSKENLDKNFEGSLYNYIH